MKVNELHRKFVESERKKGRKTKYIRSSLIHAGLSKSQAANCLKHGKIKSAP